MMEVKKTHPTSALLKMRAGKIFLWLNAQLLETMTWPRVSVVRMYSLQVLEFLQLTGQFLSRNLLKVTIMLVQA
uniref:Uncharacterized protein n=1 Tax=Arundo donax TaxID=35708 RepID=A0A0A9HQB4_ARUDO